MTKSKKPKVDLPNDGRVHVIDPKHQFFNGKVYFRKQDGRCVHKVNGRFIALHLEVWKFYHGEIPDGYVVHHEHRKPDGSFDKDENNIDWLRLMKNSDHAIYHGQNRVPVEKICAWCGNTFTTLAHFQLYCKPECREAQKTYARKEKERAKALMIAEKYNELLAAEQPTVEAADIKCDMEVRICPSCLKTFLAKRNSKTITCNDPKCVATAIRFTMAKNRVAGNIPEPFDGTVSFTNEELGVSIRALIIEGVPWFVGVDVCKALEYKRSNNAIKKRVSDEDKKMINISEYGADGFTPERGGTPNKYIIKLKGLLRLSNSSKMPKAEAFSDWILTVVLPELFMMSVCRMLFAPTDKSADPIAALEPAR